MPGRRWWLGFALWSVVTLAWAEDTDFAALRTQAGQLTGLRTLHVAQHGELLFAERFNGADLDAPANIKSASKSLVSALVGIAIERGVLEGPDQRIAPLLEDQLPPDPDPRIHDITIGHLLSMQAGLERTSGRNYGAWVSSDNWVRDALARPFEAEPGGRMQYSTGSTHLLSAILTQRSGRDTHALANDWLAPAGIRVTGWLRDPQGIPMGGNQTSMRPASLLALGELYRRDGLTADGTRLLPAEWIEQSWTPRTRSRYHGGGYGYGWFMERFSGYPVYYGWGYGGQMIYVIPELELSVAITSDPNNPSGRSGYRRALHGLVAELILPFAQARLDDGRTLGAMAGGGPIQ